MNSDEMPAMTDLRIGKMDSAIIVILGILLVATTGVGVYLWQQKIIDARDASIASLQTNLAKAKNTVPKSAAPHYTSTHGVSVIVYAPLQGVTVSNPLGVIGEVPGNWSFEAAFPAELQDSNGATVARGTAQVLGNWASSQLTPFSVRLVYADAPKGTGTLILHRDNESGLAKNDDEVRIPVRF